MAYEESLAGGIRDALANKLNIEEKTMFGGLGFLLNKWKYARRRVEVRQNEGAT